MNRSEKEIKDGKEIEWFYKDNDKHPYAVHIVETCSLDEAIKLGYKPTQTPPDKGQ